MKKFGWLPRISVLLFVAACLAACSATGRPAGAIAAGTPRPVAIAAETLPQTASPVVLSMSQPPVTPTATLSTEPPETATVMAAPSSTPMQTSWPMATPAPAATPFPPGAALGPQDYYIVSMHSINESELDPESQNDDYDDGEDYNSIDRCGVVDRHGNVLLPFIYSSIEEICDASAGAGDTIRFFAEPFQLGRHDVLTDGSYGYLFDSHGKRISNQRYDWVSNLAGGLISEKPYGGYAGVVDLALKQRIPFKYSDIVTFGSLIAAVRGKGRDCYIDFYDLNCNLKDSLPVGSEELYPNEDTLVAMGRNGRFGVIDETMKWTCQPSWSTKDMDLDQFPDDNATIGDFLWDGLIDAAVRGGDVGETWLDRYGNPFLPAGYSDLASASDDYMAQYYDGHPVFIATGDKGAALVNDVGEILFQTDKTSSSDDITYYPDGIILCAGEAYDMGGKRLLPSVEGIKQWIPEEKLFMSKNACYRQDGTILPLPACASVQFLTHDRFLIQTIDNRYGICNENGLWFVPPSTDCPNHIEWPVFYDNNTDADRYSQAGLLDINGNIIISRVCDYIYDLGGGVYEVDYNGQVGLVDSAGRCFWHTSEYDALTD